MAAGLVGRDVLGEQILQECRQNKIDVHNLKTTPKAPTSYTDVMTEQRHGRRTFFHARGANALWRGEDLDFTKVRSRIFHLGYLLLLDGMDEPDTRYGTRAARVLFSAQAAGLKISLDVVSEDSDRFAKIVCPALKHVDYCILNEIEAGKTTGFELRPGGVLDLVALQHAAGALLQHGAHCRCFCMPLRSSELWSCGSKKFTAGPSPLGNFAVRKRLCWSMGRR
jgi:sugar/nucleoside kinase (ribokinase family)